MISETHGIHNSAGHTIITDSKDLTENQVMTLLKMFNWDERTINVAINKASVSPWEPMPVGLRFTVMCTQYVARMRYRVSVVK